MPNPKNSRGIFLVYTSFVALCSILVVAAMLLSPSEPRNAVFLGLSLIRLVFAIGLLAVFIFFLILFIRGFQNGEWAQGILEAWFGGGSFSKVTLLVAGISFGLGWTVYFLPAYRAGILGSHWNRIQPLMAFILPASIATLAVLLAMRTDFSARVGLKISSTVRLGVALFLAGMVGLALMLYSKYGLYALEDFWYGAGVPILTSQLILAIFGSVLFLLIKRDSNSRRADMAIFILLYAFTAMLWAREPLQESFMFTGPRAPNQVPYPFADAATFDAASQFSLIGQGIFIYNTPFFERSLYLSFLVYLHSLFGQNYETLMMAQAAVFAIFSPLMYLIGRSLNMRAVGFAAAIVATLRGINSIAASNMIDLAGPKIILTDFPAAIGVALIVLFTCEWLKRPEKKWHIALWVGGAIGMTLMLRTNALLFLVFIPLYALFRLAPRWKTWLVSSVLILLGIIAITLPWEFRNLARGGMMYGPIVTKIQDVIRTRYTPALELNGASPQDKGLSLLTFKQTEAISSLYGDVSNFQDTPCDTFVCFAPKHFLHNVITSILTLPTSPVLDDLRHTVKESHPFWRADWDGNFTPSSFFFVGLNVFFIMLGISVAWKQKHLAGLAPLAVFLIYTLSNALARTSGGRYIVPMDWIVPLYFMMGILFLVKETAQAANLSLLPLFDPEDLDSPSTRMQRPPWLQAGLVLALLFGVGSFIPLSEKLHPARYADVNVMGTLQEQEVLVEEAGLELEQIHEFLENPTAEILIGRTLYPRSYKLGQGDFRMYFEPYTVMDFPRTGFILIGPDGQNGVVLPGRVHKYLPHATDALVIGCREPSYVDALLVILLDETQTVYARAPMTELTCPLKQPVCENNTVCN